MKHQPKKRSVKKNKDDIEVSMGDGSITKYDIMTSIAKKYTIYEATVWLNTPTSIDNGKTPAELMIDGKFEIVLGLVGEKNDQLSS